MGYSVKWKVLNTRDYGIPQSRNRVFIVGTKGKDFEWPEKVEMDDIKNYIDTKDTQKYKISGNRKNFVDKINQQVFGSVYIDLSFVQKHDTYTSSFKVAPCLNTGNGLWNMKCNRYGNIKEYLMLQGFHPTFKNIVSISQLKKQIGNSMSVNVVKHILLQIL